MTSSVRSRVQPKSAQAVLEALRGRTFVVQHYEQKSTHPTLGEHVMAVTTFEDEDLVRRTVAELAKYPEDYVDVMLEGDMRPFGWGTPMTLTVVFNTNGEAVDAFMG